VAVKFGISFTSRFLNQGNALVNLHTDGTVQVSTGGTEMGQGLNVKIRHVVASCFGISDEDVMVMATSTDKNHNTSPTAASSGSDINCAAAEIACNQIIDRIKNVAAQVFERNGEPLDASEEYEFVEGLDVSHIRLIDSQVYSSQHTDQSMTLSELLGICYFNRISLSGYGFFKTAGIYFDKEKGRGTPFLYFTNGTAVSEVSVNRFTGEVKVLRTDILMDLGRPINEAIDYGQVAGGFIQGMGWATTENLYYGDNGMLISHSPTTYKIPSIQDMPREFNMELLANDGNVLNVRRSKAVGEPPLVLGISAWSAAKDAISYLNKDNSDFALPATNEEVLKFIDLDEE
jgi:xanthine dehydrogenase large subunit